jgi:hypothetical protein
MFVIRTKEKPHLYLSGTFGDNGMVWSDKLEEANQLDSEYKAAAVKKLVDERVVALDYCEQDYLIGRMAEHPELEVVEIPSE